MNQPIPINQGRRCSALPFQIRKTSSSETSLIRRPITRTQSTKKVVGGNAFIADIPVAELDRLRRHPFWNYTRDDAAPFEPLDP